MNKHLFYKLASQQNQRRKANEMWSEFYARVMQTKKDKQQEQDHAV